MTATETTRQPAECLACGAHRVGTYIDGGVRKFATHRYSGTRYPALCLGSDVSVDAQADAFRQVEAFWTGSVGSPTRLAEKLAAADRREGAR